MADETTDPTSGPIPPPNAGETRFVNGMRLDARHWLAVAAIVVIVWVGTPWAWRKVERFDTGADYRIPYALSKDYWLYERRLKQLTANSIAVVGDSVVWGEYVRPQGTLSHFLNEQSGTPGRFINAGVNGLFPLALEGLVRHYGAPLHGGKVLLHCNVLWMSSPKADLHTEKEQRFNHADLVPQFFPRIPCYRADLDERLAVVVNRHFTFGEWANHLQLAYFGQQNIPRWTLEEDGGNPPRYPNAWKNPFTQIALRVPPEPVDDPERGPGSPRHRPWSTSGEGSTRFEWVELDESLQWAAFRRLIARLQSRGNDVFVLVGPFNEHIMDAENLPAFRRLRDDIARWLVGQHIAHVVPPVLPSPLYADASHPLTEGYEQLASRLLGDPTMQKWLDPK